MVINPCGTINYTTVVTVRLLVHRQIYIHNQIKCYCKVPAVVHSESRATKHEVRRLERRFKSKRTPEARTTWRTALRFSRMSSHSKAASYWRAKIATSGGDVKSAWKTINSLLGKTKTKCEPSFSAVHLNDFIDKKIDDIRKGTDSASAPFYTVHSTSNLKQFKKVDVDLVTKIIRESSTKHCNLDPIPTWLVKDCASLLAPYITRVVNHSVIEDSFPFQLKHATISPLIKKFGLDDTILSSYRPVSNLPFLSNVLERVIQRQTIAYLDENNLLPDAQSAYRRGHSTETALLKVFSDLIAAMDNGRLVLLSVLDLSAAFDTVDHDILHQRMSTLFGITGKSLQWFHSYLKDLARSVFLSGDTTTPLKITTGVPQGSVLGPLLFTLYTADIGTIIKAQGLLHHSYADDNHRIPLFRPNEIPWRYPNFSSKVGNGQMRYWRLWAVARSAEVEPWRGERSGVWEDVHPPVKKVRGDPHEKFIPH